MRRLADGSLIGEGPTCQCGHVAAWHTKTPFRWWCGYVAGCDCELYEPRVDKPLNVVVARCVEQQDLQLWREF